MATVAAPRFHNIQSFSNERKKMHNSSIQCSYSSKLCSTAHVGNSLARLSSIDSTFNGVPMFGAYKTLQEINSRSPNRSVITMVIPFTRGPANKQPPPDIASLLFSHRIIYLGMPFAPAVTELLTAQFSYLNKEDPKKPIYLYINSTGITRNGEKLGYETEALFIYDLMKFVDPPVYTLAIGNAWGEAALLLAAGAKGNRAALSSAKIMLRQPIGRFRGQATDLDIQRRELKEIRRNMLNMFARELRKDARVIMNDTLKPKYFTPQEALEYGIIDKVLEAPTFGPQSVVEDFKRRQIL